MRRKTNDENVNADEKKFLAAAGEVMNRFYTYSVQERQNILDNITRVNHKSKNK